MSKPDNENSPAVVMAELLNVVTPQVERIEEGFKAIRVTLDALADHLRDSNDSPVAAPPREPVSPDLAAVAEPDEAVSQPAAPKPDPSPPNIPQAGAPQPPVAVPVQTPPTPAAAEPVPVVEPAPPQAEPLRTSIPVSGGAGGNWSEIVFGGHLGTIAGISALSGTLLADVYAGDNDAVGLLGQLLTFRSATAERKPKMLKEMGEAFYLWKPRGEPALRDALISWVHALLDEAGIANRIEIVQVGDRYDLQRHNSRERGVEIGDVYGWSVLRENGKVYSKASVSAK